MYTETEDGVRRVTFGRPEVRNAFTAEVAADLAAVDPETHDAVVLTGEDDASVADRWGVTPRQAEALQTALDMGYFEVPRRADSGDVAAELGLSKPAFLERLWRGQAHLFREAL